jgi:hypothetical protein
MAIRLMTTPGSHLRADFQKFAIKPFNTKGTKAHKGEIKKIF